MLIEHNPDDYEVVSEQHTCPFHKKHPGKTYAGCTCSGSHGLRRKALIPDKLDPASLERIRRL
jgi:hypothetical protein